MEIVAFALFCLAVISAVGHTVRLRELRAHRLAVAKSYQNTQTRLDELRTIVQTTLKEKV